MAGDRDLKGLADRVRERESREGRGRSGELRDGAHVAVVGGGPAGSLFSICLLRFARMCEKKVSVTIFEPKDFVSSGVGSCNKCGGVISELLLQTLLLDGISVDDSIVERGISTYSLHTRAGSVTISSPSHEKSIASVNRGWGIGRPSIPEHKSFDGFLLDMAREQGATHSRACVDRIERDDGRLRLYAGGKHLADADCVVGACGVNGPGADPFDGLELGRRGPRTTVAGMAEITFDSDTVPEQFRDTIHLFLLSSSELEMAAVVPKKTHLTVCLIGKKVDRRALDRFLQSDSLRGILPPSVGCTVACRCLPLTNIGARMPAFADGVVLIGDAGATTLNKDGIGAAYVTAKAAAQSIVLNGVSRRHFRRGYWPTYRRILINNFVGVYLHRVITLYRTIGILTRSLVKVVALERRRERRERIFSSVLWDMFSGSEDYVAIVRRGLNIRMHLDVVSNLFGALFRRNQ